MDAAVMAPICLNAEHILQTVFKVKGFSAPSQIIFLLGALDGHFCKYRNEGNAHRRFMPEPRLQRHRIGAR